MRDATYRPADKPTLDGKPTGLITASANGNLGHKELYLIMKTFTPRLSSDTTLLIQAVKGKIDKTGTITDAATATAVQQFAHAFVELAYDSVLPEDDRT